MAQPAWLNKYLTFKPEVHKIFDDLEAYHDWCRFELAPFNEADLYKKNSPVYSAYMNSKRPRKPYQGKNAGQGRKRNEQNIPS
jgi:hypothetical protein